MLLLGLEMNPTALVDGCSLKSRSSRSRGAARAQPDLYSPSTASHARLA